MFFIKYVRELPLKYYFHPAGYPQAADHSASKRQTITQAALSRILSRRLCPNCFGVSANVYIETYGCSFNVSDSEVMAGLLTQGGYTLVENPESADVIVVNSCTVKDRTYLDIRKRMRGMTQPVVLAGCLPRVYSQSREFAHVSQLGPDSLGSIVEIVEATLRGHRAVELSREGEARLSLAHRRKNPGIEIIPISKGCLGSCTFCQTVLARGRLQSFPERQILERIRRAVDEGVSQIWLTSQDCGAYGQDCGTDLPELMEKVSAINGDFVVRIGMTNPDLLKRYLPRYIDAFSDYRFYRFAHIPVQSGNDRVLREMARDYTTAEFREICSKVKESIPNLTIATDVIAGFPTETDEEFEDSLTLLREIGPPVINRSRFSPRPGTRAARLPLHHSRVLSRRSKQLSTLSLEIAQSDNQKYFGTVSRCVVEELPRMGVLVARNASYRPIVLLGDYRPGEWLQVKVTGVDGYHLTGELA